MTIKLVIPGQPEAGKFKTTGDELFTVETVHAATLTPMARALGVEHEIEVEDDDILELEVEGGFTLWTRADQYRDDLAELHPQGLKEPQTVRLDALPQRSLQTRGVRDWIARALRVLRLKPISEEVAKATVSELTRRIEDKLAPGFYRCWDPQALDPAERITEPLDCVPDTRILVLIHGTASSTSGSFGALSATQEWQRLQERFGQHIYALEHRTLSESPITNARELTKLLPRQVKLHLVSHSRGGLVGELLCRGPVLDEQIRRFTREDKDLAQYDEEDRKALRALAGLLTDKGIQVERFVRVACPARGTLLASERLDRYLSLIVNLLGLIPPLKASPTYHFAKEVLLALVKRRAAPRDLPGLEAMMPKAPLIALLNDPEVETDADLGIIAGDIEGGGLLQRLRVFATDLFYREDHDLVVNTEAMYGGVRRPKGTYFYFDQGPEVSHFNYFRNPRTRAQLDAWLARPEGGQVPGFQLLKVPVIKRVPSVPRGRLRNDRPVVFVLPGIMGTHLMVEARRIWLAIIQLARGGIRQLSIDNEGVAPDEVFARYYGELIGYLSDSHQVIPFPYDWRNSIAEEGRRLGLEVMAALGATPQPVRLLVHSMGGLVARAMIAGHPEVWEELCSRPGARLVMLGTPNHGSYAIPQMLLGQDRLTRQLALLDLRHSEQQLLEFIVAYPGVLEMLPRDPERDFLAPASWEELKEKARKERKALPDPTALQRAALVRDQIAKVPPHPERICFVAGSAPATPCGLSFKDGRAVFQATAAGDGRVTYALGELPDVATWYMAVEHGSLASHAPAFPALLELLTEGRTARLETRPPRIERAREVVFELPPVPVLYPTEEELIAAALGAEPILPGAPRQRVLKVAVVHGNLRYARYPVVVGHYWGDTLAGAEAYLDEQLDRALSQRYQLGLYPGPSGTVEVLLRVPTTAADGTALRARGAVIVGLGGMGELTPPQLAEGIRLGTLRYALQLAECRPPAAGINTPSFSAGLNFLLIGCGNGPGLTVEESVAAALRGVVLANRELEVILGENVGIDEVEFIEVYEDQAIQGAHALLRVARRLEQELNITLEVRTTLRQGRGGWQRTTLSLYARYWRRILVAAVEGGLRYTVLSDRARTEVTVEQNQRQLIEGFIQASIRSSLWQPDNAKTLFELLIPNTFKDRLAEMDQLVLVVDAETANYPWELLADRQRKEAQPLAVQTGLVRQLETRHFRAQIRAATSVDALVVADPLTQGWPELPGARQEGQVVADLLSREGFKVHSQIQAPPYAIVNELMAHRSYRIIHLAGHGDYQPAAAHVPERSARSGMVLGEGLFLTAVELGKLREVPDLVFINCCHLGQIDPERQHLPAFNKLAASVSRELIEMGVRAVIAAGWVVQDDAAKLFADTFYGAMLQGESFGRAVLLARQATYRAYPDNNTWGAYQAYGDPDFILRTGPGGAVIEAPPPILVAPREYLMALGNITSDAQNAGEAARPRLQRALEKLLTELPVEWRDRGDILEQVGKAWGELGEFKRAIDYYERALAHEEASVSLRLVEQLANLEVRWGRELGRSNTDQDQARAREIIHRAIGRLELLLQLGKTSERLALLASAYKRLASVAKEAKEVKIALEKSRDYYRLSADQGLNWYGRLDPYPELNWLTCQVLLGNPVPDLDERLLRCELAARQRLAAEPSFWDAVAPADAAVLRGLMQGDLEQQQEEIIRLYSAARRQGVSLREWQSVLEHLTFLVEILERLPGGSGKRELRTQSARGLAGIRKRLSPVE